MKKIHKDVVDEYKSKIESLVTIIHKKKGDKSRLKEDLILVRNKLRDLAKINEKEQAYNKVLSEYIKTPSRQKTAPKLEKVISTVL